MNAAVVPRHLKWRGRVRLAWVQRMALSCLFLSPQHRQHLLCHNREYRLLAKVRWAFHVAAMAGHFHSLRCRMERTVEFAEYWALSGLTYLRDFVWAKFRPVTVPSDS